MIQVVANTIASAAAYLLVALGFSLIYRSAQFFHFAHGGVLTISAYTTFSLWHWVGMPLAVAACGGIAVGAVLGAGMEILVFRRMRNRRASTATLLLASLGLYISLQAMIALVFGAGTQTFRRGQLSEPIELLGARLTLPQVSLVAVAVVCWLLVTLGLRRTTAGKLLRAVASDPSLAEAYGICRNRIILIAFVTGSALAGIAGILLAFDADMTPGMGFQLLLMGVVAMVVGGVGSVGGVALGALLIAFAEHASAWYLSSQWQNATVFVILILFLLLRPQGFLGKPQRKATV